VPALCQAMRMKNVVGGPPVLRIGHQRVEVLDDGTEVERLEFRGVVEVAAHRAGQWRILLKRLQVQLFRPPLLVRRRRGRRVGMRRTHHRALVDSLQDLVSHTGSLRKTERLVLLDSDGQSNFPNALIEARACRGRYEIRDTPFSSQA